MAPMTATLISVGLFVVLLALVPVALKWVQQRSVRGASGSALAPKVISAIAVGPTQRVVTIEVGPAGARTWLTLGVTAQTITCLHSDAVDATLDTDPPQAIAGASTLP